MATGASGTITHTITDINNEYALSGMVTLNAIQLGGAYIGNDRYVPYICVDGVYAQYEPYIGAADGSAWILQGG